MLNYSEYNKSIKFSQINNFNELVYSFKKISPKDYLLEDEYNKIKDFII